MSNVHRTGSILTQFPPRLLTLALVVAGALWSLGFGALAGAATLELTGPVGVAVAIDGAAMGTLPLDGPLTLAVGKYRVTAKAQGYMPFAQTVNLTGDKSKVLLHLRLTPFSRKKALAGNLLAAGLGQFYVGEKTRGWVYLLAEAGGLVTALGAEMQRRDNRNDFLLLQERYDSTIVASEIATIRAAVDQAYLDMEDMEKLRDTGLLVAGGAIILSMLDTLFFFPSAVDLGPGPVAPTTACLDDGFSAGAPSLQTIHAGIRLAF